MTNMAKQDKTRQLNVEQLNAIDLLVQGKSDRETAEAVGVSKQTVTDWRNNNPAFIAELNRRREEIWGSQVDKLRSLVAEAVKVLEEDMKNTEDLRLRQSAAVYVLRSVGLYGAELEPEGPTDRKEVEVQKKREGRGFDIPGIHCSDSVSSKSGRLETPGPSYIQGPGVAVFFL